MPLSVLGAFIVGAFILGAILVLIYILRELFYEATGVENQPRPEEPLDEEERLISQNISSGYAYPCKQIVPPLCLSGETNCLPPCDGERPSLLYTLEAAKQGLKTAFNAAEEFVFGDNTPSDSD